MLDLDTGKVQAFAPERIPGQVDKTESALDLVLAGWAGAQFRESSGCNQVMLQALGQLAGSVLGYPEEIDEVAIDVVDDLPVAGLFREEQLGRSREDFHVSFVRRYHREKGLSEISLAAWPAEWSFHANQL